MSSVMAGKDVVQKEKAFRIAYGSYIGISQEVDDVLENIKNVSSCLDFFIIIKSNLSVYPIDQAGVRALLELSLDGSLSEQDRAYRVLEVNSVHTVYPKLSVFPFYFDVLIKRHVIPVYRHIIAKKKGYYILLQTLENHPNLSILTNAAARATYADGVFHLTGVAREMFIEGVSVSVNTLRDICA